MKKLFTFITILLLIGCSANEVIDKGRSVEQQRESAKGGFNDLDKALEKGSSDY